MVGKFAARDIAERAHELKEFERQLRRERRGRPAGQYNGAAVRRSRSRRS